MITDSCVILGSGNSLQAGIALGLWKSLDNQVTIVINDLFQVYEGTCIVFGDWTFYRDRFDLLKTKPLIIGRSDGAFVRKDKKGQPLCPKADNTFLIKSSSKYHGINSIKEGCYTGILTGIFTISLAIGLGFKIIYLLGMDNCEVNNKTHVYQDSNLKPLTDEEGKVRTGIGKNKENLYKSGIYNKTDEQLNRFWLPFLEQKDVKILNVSPESRINIFKKLTYPEFLSQLTPNNLSQDIFRVHIQECIESQLK